jgi:hypothetical protein
VIVAGQPQKSNIVEWSIRKERCKLEGSLNYHNFLLFRNRLLMISLSIDRLACNEMKYRKDAFRLICHVMFKKLSSSKAEVAIETQMDLASEEIS